MLKKISFWFAFFFLNIALVLTLVTLPVSTKLTSRESVKSWVSNPEVLEGALEVVPTLLSDAITDEDTVGLVQIGEQALGINKDELIKASSEVITAEYISEKMFPVIDGVYDWLEGKTDSPQFEVVLSDRLTALAQSVSGPLKSELALLPACPSNLEYSPDFNPIEAFCVPTNVDINQIVDEFSQQFTSSAEISDISISSDDIEFDEEVLTAAPSIYEVIRGLPYIYGTMALLLSVGFVLLASSPKKGFSGLSWVYIVNGAFTAVSFWLLGNSDIFFRFNSDGSEYNIYVDKIAEPFARLVLSDIASTGILLSLVAIAIGVVIWLANYTHHKLSHEQETTKKAPKKKTKSTDVPTSRQEARYLNKIAKK